MNSLVRSLSKLSLDINGKSVGDEEQNMATVENHLQKWNLPKVSKRSVYQMGIFDFKKDYSIKTREHIISLNGKLESIALFDQYAVRRHKNKYPYLHVGLVQVGVKPLTREGLNASILLCLRDRRWLDFNQSLLGAFQSNLDDGPVYFNCFPDIIFCLEDPNVWNLLTINVKLYNLEMKETTFPVVLIYRVHYKCLLSAFKTGAKKCSFVDKSLFFQTNLKIPHLEIPKIIKWSEIQFPEEWKLRQEKPPKKQEPESSPIRQLPDGSVRIQFPSRNSGESSTTWVFKP